MNFLEILFFELYLVRDRDNFFFEAVDFFFVDGDVLDLVSHRTVLVVGNLLWLVIVVAVFNVLRLLGVVNCLLDSLLEVKDLVIDKVLVYLHLLLEILHLSLINKL